MLKDLAHLVFPNNCLSCGNHLMKQEETFCTECEINFPYTRFSNLTDNPVINLFKGRCTIDQAYSLVYFRKGGKTQNLLHDLKYKNKPEIGERFGVLIGNELKKLNLHFDVIIAVALHPKKEKKRGYNQAYQIAIGIHKVLGKILENSLLKRIEYNESQTTKNRYTRWENTKDIFSCGDNIKNLNSVLLVDDVITTGSTIEACVNAIHKINPTCKVSVCSIGVAV